MRVRDPWRTAPAEEAPPESEGARVVIVGYGRVGALIGDMLDMHKMPFIAVDADARLVARARAAGKAVYYGNASRPDYLRTLRRRDGARRGGDDGLSRRQRGGGGDDAAPRART